MKELFPYVNEIWIVNLLDEVITPFSESPKSGDLKQFLNYSCEVKWWLSIKKGVSVTKVQWCVEKPILKNVVGDFKFCELII